VPSNSPYPWDYVTLREMRLSLIPISKCRQASGRCFAALSSLSAACATVRHFRQQHLLFPRRVRCGAHQGEIAWGEIQHHDVLRVLHHPAYAGAYAFGRTRTTKTVDGKVHIQDVPRAEWVVLVKDAHVGYIRHRGLREK
jgi:hypothetical protein